MAIGQGERTLIARCLADLDVASEPQPSPPTATESLPEPASGGILKRVLEFFF